MERTQLREGGEQGAFRGGEYCGCDCIWGGEEWRRMAGEGEEDFVEHVESGCDLRLLAFPLAGDRELKESCMYDSCCDLRFLVLKPRSWVKRINVPRSSNRHIESL